MRSRDEIVPLLLSACPSFAEPWAQYEAENTLDADDPEDGPLPYIDANEFARHLVSLAASGQTKEFPAVFDVFELLLRDEPALRTLIRFGYFEDIQNCALRDRLNEAVFLDVLGPEGLDAWRSLNESWSGSPTWPTET